MSGELDSTCPPLADLRRDQAALNGRIERHLTHLHASCDQRRSRVTVLTDGYWCESSAACLDTREEWTLGEYRAASPDEALTWILRHAEDLADATSGAVADTLTRWCGDRPYHRVQLDALDAGQHISANVRCWDRIVEHGRVELIYRLSVRPIKVTFGAGIRVADVLPGAPEARPRGQDAGVWHVDLTAPAIPPS